MGVNGDGAVPDLARTAFLLVLPGAARRSRFWFRLPVSLVPLSALHRRGDHIARFIDAWRDVTGGDELWDYSEGLDLLDEFTLHPAFPAALAQAWSAHGGLRRRLARNPMLPPELLRAFADDPDAETAESARTSLARLGRPVPALPVPEVLPRPTPAPVPE